MAQLEKGLPSKHEDLSLLASSPHKSKQRKTSVVVNAYFTALGLCLCCWDQNLTESSLGRQGFTSAYRFQSMVNGRQEPGGRN